MRVVVIDDDEDVLDLIHDILAMQDHVVAAFRSGEDALARLDEVPFDLLITDLGMPGMTGWEVAKWCHDRFPKLPIVLMSGWGSEITAGQRTSCGAWDVLPKPFGVRQVADLMEQYAVTHERA